MNEFYAESDYQIWTERFVVSECLRQLGYNKLALTVHTDKVTRDIISSYIRLIENTARALKKQDVLEILAMSGLIYG